MSLTKLVNSYSSVQALKEGGCRVIQASHCRFLILSYLIKSWLYCAAYGLLIVFIATLSGCSNAPTPVMKPTAPLYYVPPETWQVIDEQIFRASVSARHKSVAYARLAMNNWLQRVRQRTEDVFIPWYSSYWTQQWMATRVAWYKLQYNEGEVTPEERMASYLQQQFYEQVLQPVSRFIDPRTVMKEVTATYLRELKDRLDQLPYEYTIPVVEFEHHLEFIPAIMMQEVPLQDASLHEVLQTTDLSALPAYKTLRAQINAFNDGVDPTSSNNGLDRVANRAVAKLLEQMELRGGATVASFIVGGYLGMFISAGSATWSVTEHEQDKPKMEVQLQDNIDMMLDVMWQGLVEDTGSGVTAVVHHMSKQIEYAVFTIDPAGSRLF